MNTKNKIVLVVVTILIVSAVLVGGAGPGEVKNLKTEYSLLEIGLGVLFLSSWLWVPLLLVLFAPSMTR